MACSTTIRHAIVLVLVIHLTAVSCIYLFLQRSSYLDSLRNWLQREPLVLPGSLAPALTWFSGAPTDALLTVAGIMFANITDGSSPTLSLYGLQFAGQLVGLYTLVTIEGIRRGNKSTVIHFTMAWGFSMQILSYAFTMPLFCLAHLLSSDLTGKQSAKSNRIGHLIILETLPTVLVISYFLPSCLYALPLPQELNALHQWFGGLWQGFPLYIALVQMTIPIWHHRIAVPNRQPDATIIDLELSALRRAYSFAFSSCVATHAPIVMIGVVSILCRNFNIQLGSNQITISAIFVPQAFYLLKQVDMADGIHFLLIYDQFFGSSAALVWAWAINVDARSKFDVLDILTLVSRISVCILISGPAGAALWLLWDRDERLWKLMK